MSKYLDDIERSTRSIRDIAIELCELGESFHHTGNLIVGDKLMDLSEELKSSERTLNQAVSIDINDRCQQAYQNTSNMVVACLNMSLISDKHDD